MIAGRGWFNMETQTAEHTLANIIIDKESGKADFKGLVQQVPQEQRDAVMEIIAAHYIGKVRAATSSEKESENRHWLKSNLEKLAELAEMGCEIDAEQIDSAEIHEMVRKSMSGDFLSHHYLEMMPHLRSIGITLKLPELAEAGYKALSNRCSRKGPRALIEAHRNGEQIDHARAIEIAKEIHSNYPSWGGGIDEARGALKFLRIISALKEGINLDADIPELFEEVGFSLENFECLQFDVIEMPTHLDKLGLFNASEFENIILNEAKGMGDFHDYGLRVFRAMETLESIDGYEPGQDFMQAVYNGFKSALRQEFEDKCVIWFLEATEYFRKKGIEPDMEGLASAEAAIYDNVFLDSHDRERILRIHEFGYDTVPGLTVCAFTKLVEWDDPDLRTAFWALETIKKLGGTVDPDRIINIGVNYLKDEDSDSREAGKAILAKAKQLYGAEPEPAIANLLDYAPE